MPVPLHFSQEEIETITALAAPMSPPCRTAYLEAVATEIRNHGEHDIGLVHRVGRELQSRFYQPDVAVRRPGASSRSYGR